MIMEQTMHALDQKVKEFAIHVGLNNIISRDTSPQVDQRGQTENCAIPRRAQTPTERVKYQLWPNLKKVDAILGRHTPDIAELQRSPPNEGGLGRRRKISVPEIGPMATVQEKAIDSPTIPGRFPLHERSNSAPGAPWDRGDSTRQPARETPKKNGEKNAGHTALEGNRQKSLTRASSVLLPELEKDNPTKIHEEQRTEDDQGAPDTSSSQRSSQEKPPSVPPKSPRLVAGASNGPVSAFTGENGETHKIITTTQSDADLHRGYHNRVPQNATCRHWRSQTSLETGGSFTPWITTKLQTKKRVRYADDPAQTEDRPSTPANQMQPIRQHKRDMSQDSIMDRGRPKRKKPGQPEAQKPIPETNECTDIKTFPLPIGTPVHAASKTLPYMEVERLQNQAREQAERFEVLKYREVRTLSKELHALDKRCEYLRETYTSLRSGRRGLHNRMVSYLRSPRVAKFSRDGILKQEEALAELDQSIDEWHTKLELAENRRTRIRQKLLEHMAAALILRQPTFGGDHSQAETPPRSPQKAESPTESKRQDVESIKIYADAELQALFVDIEEGMEKMVSTDNPGSPSLETPSPADS